MKRAVPRGGDLVITREAPMGEVCELPPGLKCCMGQRMVLLRPEPRKVVGRYFLFALQSRPVQLQIGMHEGTGSTVSNLRIPALKSLRIPWYPLPEQRRIAAVLGALDDKIELNRKMNRTLEEMAQAIFKSWFIDFDGRDNPVDSELGPIPRGWSWVPFAEAGRWVSGGTPSKKSPAYWGGEIPWFSAKSLGELFLDDADTRVTDTGAANGTRLVPRGTVLFIVRGMSLAKEWRIGMVTRKATLNQDLKGIVDDGTVVPELLLLWLLHHREIIRQRTDEAGHGTKRLPTAVLHSFSLALPPRSEQERLAKNSNVVSAP